MKVAIFPGFTSPRVRDVEAELVHADAGDYRAAPAVYNRLGAAVHGAAEHAVAVAYWQHPLCGLRGPVVNSRP